MILISNNAQKYMTIPKDAVVRVNMAWIKTKEELWGILSNGDPTQEVFLDFPKGRNKPPKPVLTLDDAYSACGTFQTIRYFAVSNVEDVGEVLEIQKLLPPRVTFIPKIETLKGIKQFGQLVYECGIKTAMVDKEDLYLDVKKNNDEFFKCVDHIRNICEGLKVQLLELEGVLFTTKTFNTITTEAK